MFSEDFSSGSLSGVSSSDEESLSEDESDELELELSSEDESDELELELGMMYSRFVSIELELSSEEEDSWTPLLLCKSSSPDILL